MEELIRFRLLSDKLDDTEYMQFVVECIKSKGRNFFNRLLFNEYKNSPDHEEIIPFTNMVKNIINSRESKPNIANNKEISYNKLDELPSELIGECSSFLQTLEYFNFSKVNRKIYTSIYSPSKIYQFTRKLFRKYPSRMNMKKFKNVEELEIELKTFNESLSRSNELIWKTNNNIKKLMICYYGGNTDQMQIFLNNNYIHCANITNLQLDIDITYRSFYELLSRFTMLQYLSLDDDLTGDHTVFTEKNIKTNLQKLKGLKISGDDEFLSKLINILSNQLEALSIDDGDNLIISNDKFPKLTELQLYFPDIKLLDSFNKVTTIKTAKLEIYNDEEVTKQFIKRMINNQLSLEYLSVHNFNVSSSIKEAETALFWAKDKKRRNNKLFIEFHQIQDWKQKYTKEMHLETMRLIHSLELAQIKNWRIKVTIFVIKQFDKESNEMKKWLNELENLKRKYLTYYQFMKLRYKETFCFVISNKDCNIAGYEANYCF